MDINLSAYLDPAAYMPVGLFGWALQIVPPAFGIWTERSGRRLARAPYLGALALRIIGLYVLMTALVLGLSFLIFNHDPTSDMPPPDAETWFPAIGIALTILTSLTLIRPLVRRLNDAAIPRKWAYLAMLPYVDFIMFVGLAFYPPSKNAEPVTATA
ncbi:DUF805 domain-containing protein [Dongia sp.]|uniref:DUF805 domain-containing protein n=1 Tax=Dongia sp. TaxID=1977262 RepID=UPI0035B32666